MTYLFHFETIVKLEIISSPFINSFRNYYNLQMDFMQGLKIQLLFNLTWIDFLLDWTSMYYMISIIFGVPFYTFHRELTFYIDVKDVLQKGLKEVRDSKCVWIKYWSCLKCLV